MASRPVSILELVTLREYAPLDHLFRLLPKKAQRALTLSQSSIDVELTCVDASSEFIVLGSNISVVYLFDRQEQQLARLKCEDKSCHITCVKLLTCLDHQLAVGTSNGDVEIFLLPSRSSGHSVQARKFVLEHLHQNNPVNCVEWSTNGMKLFTGDTQGKVVQTQVDFYENQCQISCVVTEDETIVQLNYAHKKLLVSTTSRTIVCTPDDNCKVTQVGQQPRKSKSWDTLSNDKFGLLSKGSFGAHFIPGLCKPSDATIYVSRPGWRLWHANTEGAVLETIMFKDLISKEHPLIRLLPDTPPAIIPPPTNLQLGHLFPFSDGLLLSWSTSSVVVLQPFGPEGALVVASNFGELGSLVSCAATRHEIFVLRKGCERSLVRIATAPDMHHSKEPVKSERDFGRIQITKLKLLGDPTKMILAPAAPIASDRMTSTKIKSKFSSMRGFLSKAADDLADKAAETKNKMERNLERSFKLNLPIPERKFDDNLSLKSDRSSVNGDDQSLTDPGTPEAMLSERLMVSVINASNMSGERSPTGQTSPTAFFRSPANSFSKPADRSRTNSLANGTVEKSSSQKPADDCEKPTETEATPGEQNQAITEEPPKELPISAVEVTALKNSKRGVTDRISIVITEDPEDDQSAHVVEKLGQRLSAAFKISQDELENINTDFCDSIVFPSKSKVKSKSKTKKKKQTVKGNKAGATIVEFGKQPTASSLEKDQGSASPSPSTRMTPGLHSICEGEAMEDDRSPLGRPNREQKQGVDPAEITRRLEVLSESEMSLNNGTDVPDSKLVCDPVPYPAGSTPYSLPQSLKSDGEGIRRLNDRLSSDPATISSSGLPDELNSPSQNSSAPSSFSSRSRLTDPVLSISLPKSLHSNDLPRKDDGELSPVVSPRSPRSPRLPEDGEGRQTRRLGVIMEDFDLNDVPEEDTAPSPNTSPHQNSPVAARKTSETASGSPSLPPRKKHLLLQKHRASEASGSRPTSEFEDIYSKYRRTVLMMKESIYIEDPPSLDSKDVKEAASSDNSETESQESDEAEEEAEPALPESIQQKLAGSWMQCATPNYIYQLVASERHVWYVDNRDKAHHSLASDISCKWSKLKDAPCRQLSVSPSGSIVWRINPKTNNACSSTAITQRSHVGYRWIDVSKDVSSVCLDEHMAWIIKQNGQLCVHKGLSREKPYTKDALIDNNAHVVQIAANNGVVWARTRLDKVVYRMGITLKKPQGQSWIELPDEENLKMVCIALDSKNAGWAIDAEGMVWFRTGVTMEKPMGDDQKWWQVCMSEYLMEDPNVLRMMVNMAGSATKVDRVVNWLKKQCYKATSIAANSSGVWVCSSYHYKTTLHVSRGNLLGSRWELSNPIGLASSATWKCVCASPSYGPSGMIWALQTSGEIFCFSPETRKPNMVQSPDGVFFDYIGATTNTVWALSTKKEIFVRMNISDRCPGGSQWKKLDLNQFGTRRIVHFTVGSDVVWAVDSTGDIHFRLGVTLPKHEALPLAWVPVDGKPVGYGVYFTHVFCGPTDDVVWAIDNKKTVYARQGVSKSMPVGFGWEPVEGTQASQLCISTDSVWALCPNGELACRFGISGDNAAGDYWKKIAGNFKYVAVSQNDELWTINNDGCLFHRLTKMFIRSTITKAAAMKTGLDQGEDDWELL